MTSEIKEHMTLIRFKLRSNVLYLKVREKDNKDHINQINFRHTTDVYLYL